MTLTIYELPGHFLRTPSHAVAQFCLLLGFSEFEQRLEVRLLGVFSIDVEVNTHLLDPFIAQTVGVSPKTLRIFEAMKLYG